MSVWRYIWYVIVSPQYGWDEVNRSCAPPGMVLTKAFFPLLAMLFLTTFVRLLYDSSLTFVPTLMTAIIAVSAYLFAYYITSYLLGGFYPELVKTEGAVRRLDDYLLYSTIFLVILNIAANLVPIAFTPIMFLMAYLPWMAYRGAPYLGIDEPRMTRFVIIVSALLLLIPIIIKVVFSQFIN